MPTVKYSIQNLKSIESRQKFGDPNQCGFSICGWSLCGSFNDVAGLYRVRHYNGKKYREKMAFYPYVITHSETQTVNRAKFASAVSAWQILPAETKAEYKKRAIGRHMFGYHLFLREYMLS